RRTLATSTSPPLSEIAIVLMKVSQNLYAETLLKAVGAAKSGLGTTEGGRLAARALMTSWGVPERGYVQADGSGLSRYDYVTADMLVTILSRMAKDPRHHDAFLATLPVAGKDGTIASRCSSRSWPGSRRQSGTTDRRRSRRRPASSVRPIDSSTTSAARIRATSSAPRPRCGSSEPRRCRSFAPR